jgi:two-component system chemotaxis sensor kinase CheA
MSGAAEDVGQLLDAVAQALILADPADAASREDVRAAVTSVIAWARAENATDPLFAEYASLATELIEEPNPTEVVAIMDRLSRRFEALREAVRRMLAAPQATAAKAPRKRAKKAAATAAPAEAEADAPAPEMPLAADMELLRDFVMRANELLEEADGHLLVLEKRPDDGETLNAAFRAFHTIKGMAGFLALTRIEECAHDTETVLDAPRRGGALEREGFDKVFAGIDTMKALVATVLPGRGASAPAPADLADESAPAAAAGPSIGPARAAVKTVRVEEDRLDNLLDAIGELVVAEAIFSASAHAEEGGLGALAPQLARLDKITRGLQEMATSLRMLPMRGTFVRMSRLIRDLSHKAGKEVTFVTSGEDTELDKGVVDAISDPLIHILRNAVDHGIESPEERVAAGKPAAGRVEITAFHSGGRIHLQVSDDGRGFDTEAIVAAARKRGLIGADERPSERAALDLVFAPGLSTAASVNDVSGRGVGMDVVRRTVDALHGDVDVRSEPGRGTRISIRLPLTLAIIDGMVIRVGGERYVVPLPSIERSVRPTAEHLSSVMGRGRMLAVGEELVPLVSLADTFEVDGAEADPEHGIVVVVSEGGDRAGLVACEILGQQQIVIKPLGDGLRDTRGIAGGAVMPDGQVGLIVDVTGLLSLARQ